MPIKSNKIKKQIKKTKTKKMQKAPIHRNKYFRNLKMVNDGTVNGYVYDNYDTLSDSTFHKDETRCMCFNYKTLNEENVYSRCKNKKMQNSDFCQLHQDCKSFLRKYLSGYELDYKPETWKNPFVEGSHNCYSYFLNRQVRAVKEKCEEICNNNKSSKKCPIDNDECSDLKPQPGDYDLIKREGSDKNKERIYQCPNMQYKILKDNISLMPVQFNTKCPNKYYKGAMVVDPGNTYHFYRQNTDGMWSHKPGISPVTNVDASNNKIYIPHFSNRDYSKDKNNNNDDGINYTRFCGYYCVPENKYIHKNLA